jgi:hypothetical protein
MGSSPNMGKKEKERNEFHDDEIARRRDQALLRALNTPPKPHSEMKLGKRKAKAGAEASPPKKRGRHRK